ncbi:hypothetical protein CNMCM8980_010369 [Aspergillus fumigatiaffinis]|jgi:hypothetical protein|uniref:Subtilisin-like serine protease n=1 Tax=Aspergillus fumigatiaffinis TaxID=340414 RepID=A0A8H4HFM9_9EURO|nr:hypothetical protein CNMCM8980_010369 [Aspergillus fumigatiaffinis]KAF4245011.1 hypothetical protein CNMCM6805_006444 [Aspergillus fumigatiaffinis]
MQSPDSSPFSVRLLKANVHNGIASQSRTEQLLAALPASYRTEDDHLVSPSNNVMGCVEKELDLQRLDKIVDWLWVVGRPMPPRPLHHQLLLGREIFITERMDMHLVWTRGRIFLKPIPRFLLEPCFWTDYLSHGKDCECSHNGEYTYSPGSTQQCARQKLWKSALGFLFSYAALITHESDFYIAKDKHLLPPNEELSWQGWRTLVEQLRTESIYHRINQRFIYGELRLSRLNKIYRLSQRPFLRGYMSLWHQYGTFFQENFQWLATATIYIAIVLTAMQVGLATKALADNDAFQSASYGFAVFSVLGPLAAAGLITLVFCYMFVNNLIVAIAYKDRRLDEIRVSSGGHKSS